MARVNGDLAGRVGGGTEQDGINNALVLECDLGGCRRQDEDHVVVGHGQQLGLARLEPLGARQALALRAVPVAAGVVGVADQAAVAALLDVATECRGAALLDRCHDAALNAAEVQTPIAPERLAMSAEHVRHLQHRAHRRRSGPGRHLELQAVERAGRAADGAAGDLRSGPWC